MDKQVKIEEAYHKDLCILSKQTHRTQKEYIEQCISYFKLTGKDPKDVNAESIVAQIKKLENKLVSFIRVQERDKIDPIFEELSVIAKNFEEKFQNIPTKKEIAEVKGTQANMNFMLNKLIQIIEQRVK